MQKRPKLSVVIPCYNEEACLEMLHGRVSGAARAAVGDDYEIVLINDGHQLALTAGLDLCAGEEILIIDADLQDPPELLTDMRAAMRAQGADVVYAVRRKR